MSAQARVLPDCFEFHPIIEHGEETSPFGVVLYHTSLIDEGLDEVITWADGLEGEMIDNLKRVWFHPSDPQTPEAVKVLFERIVVHSSGSPLNISGAKLYKALKETSKYINRKNFQQKKAGVVR